MAPRGASAAITTSGHHASADHLEDRISSWSKYEPSEDFAYFARPYPTYKSYIEQVFQPLERMRRSASANKFLYQRDVEPGLMPKSRSASTLSPSHGLPASDRVADRCVPLIGCYKTKGDTWRREYQHYMKTPSTSNIGDHHPSRSSTTMMITPPDMFRQFFAHKLTDEPRAGRIHRPVSLTRWQYGGAYASGRLAGVDSIAPYMLFPNYESSDDRPYMRRAFQVRSYGVPYPYRQYMRQYENGYDPKRVLIAYVANEI